MIQGTGADWIIVAQNRSRSAQAGLFRHNRAGRAVPTAKAERPL